MIRFFAALLLCITSAAQAQTLDFPSNASLQRTVSSPLDSHQLAVGIWENGTVPLRFVEGQLSQEVWRINAPSLTTLQLVRPLREQLRNDRYRIIFECQTEACGGFDFRFAVQVLPPPEMQINIGDFRYLAAEKMTADGSEVVSLFVSRTRQAGFVQITHVGPPQSNEAALTTAEAAPVRAIDPLAEIDFEGQLNQVGRAVLSDLAFNSGSAQLQNGEFASLRALADYMLLYPQRRLALVGHTDASGDLGLNIALSQRRAASVLERLVADFGVSRQQIEAEGVGYLMPLASNLTDAGREANRRVEVVLLSTGE